MSLLERTVFGCLMILALMLVASHWITVSFNQTHSLPYKVFLIIKGASVGRQDYVAFHWAGGHGYALGATFIKRVAGVGGDEIHQQADRVVVNQQSFKVQVKDRRGHTMEMNRQTRVPERELFVVGTHPLSLDSRYAEVGCISLQEVIGRAYPII